MSADNKRQYPHHEVGDVHSVPVPSPFRLSQKMIRTVVDCSREAFDLSRTTSAADYGWRFHSVEGRHIGSVYWRDGSGPSHELFEFPQRPANPERATVIAAAAVFGGITGDDDPDGARISSLKIEVEYRGFTTSVTEIIQVLSGLQEVEVMSAPTSLDSASETLDSEPDGED